MTDCIGCGKLKS